MGLTAVLTGKRVLLIVSGGIAAYKSLELIRRLTEKDAAAAAPPTAAQGSRDRARY
jgi:phosphopantothenoylcysteine decarboxylase/phosphopantothenate--cysteine ligase